LNKLLSLVLAKYNLFIALVNEEKLAKGKFINENNTIRRLVRPPTSFATPIKL
jgi:hypothetical protein